MRPRQIEGTTMTPPVFGILGHLEVRGRSGPERIGGRRRRQLLAYLLVNANTRVSVDRICDDVWESAPPDGAAATVRTYVSQFRRLDVEGSGLIATADSSGYDIRLDRRDLDATRFEDEVRGALRLERERRLAALDAALALWRGAALAEFEGCRWADVEATRLDVLRDAATKARFDTLLILGRHDACIPDLETALVAAPLDERLAAQLALAYYRSGRVSEGLRELGRLRRGLGEELGLPPGAEIVELERRMIDRDPELDPAQREERISSVRTGPDPHATRRLPSGTVTFLFTDIQGSTRMLRDLGDARYADVLATHRRHIESAVERHGGLVFGTEGDAVFCVFESASRAARAAVEAQTALRDERWPVALRVRMGLHAGEALVVGDDYVGATVHVAARVAAAAHGGQVVASETCPSLAPDELWRDLGWHRLKDVDRPQHLYEMDTGEETSFPPLSTADNVPSNLPGSLDVFVGREAERAELREIVHGARLVTLVGPGGVGKTRLAIETARDMRSSHPGGVHMVRLAEVAIGDGVNGAITRTLVEAGGRGTDLGTVAAHVVGHDPTLLVLDNCEHVLERVASVTTTLLGELPTLRILATSREPLGVRGERVQRVEPLHTSANDARRSAAEELFVVRAEAATGRTVSTSEAAVVRRICSSLDGLPLAIELAASRAAGLALVDVAARLDDRFELLRSTRSGDEDRHRTLAAVVRWSYELLSPTDRALFNRLSVFGHAFGVDAAEAVAADVAGGHVLDGLCRLVDKSLVQLTVSEQGSSYRLLDTLRSFGRARLAESEKLEEAEDRLLDWAMSITERLERDMRTERQDASLAAAVPHRGSLRTALDLQLMRGRPLEALRIVASVPVDTPGERARLIDQLLPLVNPDERDTIGRAHLAASNLEFERGAFGAGVEHARRAAVVFDELADARSVAWSSFLETFGAWGTGDVAGARAAIEAARAGFAELGDRLGYANASWAAILLQPDLAEADRLGESAESELRAIDSPFALAHCLEARALVELQLDRVGPSRSRLAEALDIFSRGGNDGCVAHCLEAIGGVIVHDADAGMHLVTAELLGAAEALRVASGHRHRPWELTGQRAALVTLRTSLSDEELVAAIERGRGHHLQSATELGRRAVSAVPR
jgi:predicted ATPase/class 3 adenylate cyclase